MVVSIKKSAFQRRQFSWLPKTLNLKSASRLAIY